MHVNTKFYKYKLKFPIKFPTGVTNFKSEFVTFRKGALIKIVSESDQEEREIITIGRKTFTEEMAYNQGAPLFAFIADNPRIFKLVI